MTKKDFEKFVQDQQAIKEATVPPIDIDWKAWWLEKLEDLYLQIESFLREYKDSGKIEINYSNLELNEENIGQYIAKKMIITIGRNEIIFQPIGTFLFGARGRVDIKGPFGQSRLLLVNKEFKRATDMIQVEIKIAGKETQPQKKETKPFQDIKWAWKFVTTPPEMKFIDLTSEEFYSIIMALSNAQS